MNERKVVQLKAAEYSEKGAVRAVFATLSAIDHDGDMILPGAIGEQRVRMSAYGHQSWYGELPVGKGRVYEEGENAIFEGQFFLTTTPGRDTYETVKAMGDLQEWSFALPEIESEMRTTPEGQNFRAIKKVTVPEVSPVLLGAGVNTRTLDVKNAQGPKDMKLIDHVEWLLAQANDVAERIKSVAEMREEDGRRLSRATWTRALSLAGALKNAACMIEQADKVHAKFLSLILEFEKRNTEGRR